MKMKPTRMWAVIDRHDRLSFTTWVRLRSDEVISGGRCARVEVRELPPKRKRRTP